MEIAPTVNQCLFTAHAEVGLGNGTPDPVTDTSSPIHCYGIDYMDQQKFVICVSAF
jgi:hypothetical protein